MVERGRKKRWKTEREEERKRRKKEERTNERYIERII